MVLRRFFSASSLAASPSAAAAAALCSSSSSSSCCGAHNSTTRATIITTTTSSLSLSSSLSSLSSVALPLRQQFRCAQTLKDIEKHGAKGSSKLLKDLFPDIALEVDRTATDAALASNVTNTPATPAKVDLDTLLFDSGRRVQWRCKECAYTYVSSVMARTVLKKGCPSCHRRSNPLLADAAPRLLQELHPTKNSVFSDVEGLEATSKDKLWWLCGNCSHSFQARPADRVQGKAPCPECSRGSFGDFKVKRILMEEFHPTRNGDLTLAKLRPTDRVSVWWLCHSCGHEFQCPLSLRVASSGSAASSRNTGGYGSCPRCSARKASGKVVRQPNDKKPAAAAAGAGGGAKRGRKSKSTSSDGGVEEKVHYENVDDGDY